MIGHWISFSLFFISFVFAGSSVIIDLTNSSSRNSGKFLFAGIISLGLSLFFLLLTEIGFALETFIFPTVLMIIMFGLEKFSKFLRKKSRNMSRIKDVSSLSRAVQNLLERFKSSNNKNN